MLQGRERRDTRGERLQQVRGQGEHLRTVHRHRPTPASDPGPPLPFVIRECVRCSPVVFGAAALSPRSRLSPRPHPSPRSDYPSPSSAGPTDSSLRPDLPYRAGSPPPPRPLEKTSECDVAFLCAHSFTFREPSSESESGSAFSSFSSRLSSVRDGIPMVSAPSSAMWLAARLSCVTDVSVHKSGGTSVSSLELTILECGSHGQEGRCKSKPCKDR